ncbi:GrdB-related putative oxidoreductase [Faecalicoccus pleomorphus]|uniref:GrdB-related putative oxidoreductase n=1 Tax=Faecalicoccus pleomorphus TaxID=1323 RepID=UPI001F0F7C48|nr:GrdB-related putative oxidoreductase [Faecalicoccus pleomorphus]
MLKIIMIYDQIQAGAGIKDDRMVPLSATKEAVGPAIMMESYLKEIDARVMACLYCGNGTYRANEQEVIRKLTAMVNKLKPDAVICGPCFNYADYADMAAHVAKSIQDHTHVVAVAAMSQENEAVIEEFKDQICIVKTPKKGGIGLNESLRNVCQLVKALIDQKDINQWKRICF